MAGSQVRIVWDDAAIRLDTARPGSAADRGMRQLADMAVQEIKRRLPVYTGPPRPGPTAQHPRQHARRSGTLRSSVRSFRQNDGSYLIFPTDQVAPGVFLGALLERGTRPHRITSSGPWSLYSGATRRYYGRTVMHPGTRPRPAIREAAAAMNGRRVIVRLGRRHRNMLPRLPPDCLAHDSGCYPMLQRKRGYRLALLHSDSRSIDDRVSKLRLRKSRPSQSAMWPGFRDWPPRMHPSITANNLGHVRRMHAEFTGQCLDVLSCRIAASALYDVSFGELGIR